MDRHPGIDRHPGGLDGRDDASLHDDASLLEDHTRKISGGWAGRRLGMSMPGAVAGALLVTALAFGAAFSPEVATPGGTDTQGGGTAAAGDSGSDAATLGRGGQGGEWVKDIPRVGDDAKPGSELLKDDFVKGDESPDDEPKDEPVIETLGLILKLDGSKVVVDWTACDPDGFAYYKVVRSTNDAATWPLGSGDSLVGAIGDMGTTAFVDAKTPAGTKLFYKVVAVVEHEGKLVAACVSKTMGIATPAAPKAEPKPDAGTLALDLAIVEGHPKIYWGECTADFDYYKVVRSTDSTVTWPAGANDKVVGVVGPDGNRKVYDGDAPAGKKLWYRVFCVRSAEAGYVTVAASPAKSIETPTAEPKPEPYVLGIGIDQTADGVVIEWEACKSDGFAYYKVVRSMTNTNPNYPTGDGTEIIAAIGDHTVTRFVDTKVEAGQTWFYRVICFGSWGGQKVTLGYTPVASLTVE